MSSTQERDILLATKKIGPLLFEMAVPAITAQLINLLYNLVDRVYIGHMAGEGALALTGLGVTMPIIMLISAFAGLIGYGGAPRAAICLGKGERDKAEEILGNCVTAIVLIAVGLTVIASVWKEPLLLLFGASSETLPYANDYISIYLLGTIFVQTALGLNMFITSQGFAGTSMLTVLIGAALNIILDPILIYGMHMGVRGAALATIISQGVSAVWVLRFLSGKKTVIKIRRRYLRIRREVLLPVMALGISPFVMMSTESLLSVSFNTSLLKYGGDLAVGAMTILSSMMQFAMLPMQGLTQGMQPIVSFNYGAGNAGRVRGAFRLTLLCALAYTTALWAVCMAAPELIAGAFTSEPALIAYAAWALRIYMATAFILGAQNACQQTFLALGNAKVSLFLALLRKIILLIPLIYILPSFFEDEYKVFAVFLAEPTADFIAVATTLTMFFFTFKKMMAEIEKK